MLSNPKSNPNNLKTITLKRIVYDLIYTRDIYPIGEKYRNVNLHLVEGLPERG
jgi:hypothetical protein